LRSSHPCRRGLAVSAIAVSLGFAFVPVASADPGDPATPADPATSATSATPADPGAAGTVIQYYPGADTSTVPVDSADDGSPAVTACHDFGTALDTASQFYGDFADSIDGTTSPDYNDPAVDSSNVTGRTALRQAASLAMSAAGTPGVTPDIADPMRSWSFGATKLLLKMGLHTSGATMNDTATAMNQDAGTAQMACANAGTHA
jgi:hypothetical protein